MTIEIEDDLGPRSGGGSFGGACTWLSEMAGLACRLLAETVARGSPVPAASVCRPGARHPGLTCSVGSSCAGPAWGHRAHGGPTPRGLLGSRAAEAAASTSSVPSPPGKNDGSIGGKQYFRCSPGYGLLVRPGRVRRAPGAGRRRSAGLRLQGTPEPRRSSALSGSATNLASLTAALAKAEGTAALGADRSHKNPENRKSWAS